MRVLTALILLLPTLSGCFKDPFFGYVGDRDCSPHDPVQDGFRIHIGADQTGEELEPPEGYCVHVNEDDEWDHTRYVALDADGVAWVPTDGPGDYRFFVVIPWTRDPYCGAWFEANATYHPGTGLVEVELVAETGVCT